MELEGARSPEGLGTGGWEVGQAPGEAVGPSKDRLSSLGEGQQGATWSQKSLKGWLLP